MATDLTRIEERARLEPKLVFTSLYHHVTDLDNLRASYEALDGRKAVGIDGVSKRAYGERLEENLKELSEKLRRMGYQPGLKRRSYIPKAGSAKGRPLGISNFEDKIVEMAVKRVLEAIYEPRFEDNSYGYRRMRSQHDCLAALGRAIQQNLVNQLVEADIRSFFDRVNHMWMMKFLRHRVGDERLLRLIERMLKGGILEDGLVRASEEGTPQGSVLSPLLSNIYLHYVLDLWFNKRVCRELRGEAYYFRFADDFVACFQYREDAREFLGRLKGRLEDFGLELAEDKTRQIPFGRFAREDARRAGEKPGEFDFLGFTHYCGKTRRGSFKVKRRTSRKKLGQGLQNFTAWAKKERGRMRKGEMLRKAKQKVEGHVNYYGITDNSGACSTYSMLAKRALFKWLNRKGQRKSYRWDGFAMALEWAGWPTRFVRTDLCPFRR